jgi:hypothetical protein
MTGSALQTIVVLLIVAAAAFYVGRRLWRTIAAARASKAAGCGVGCGCGDAPAVGAAPELRKSGHAD